eukprot:gnl/MRDRNA2_/MRDRNA2_77977_c0_seq2.p1 gnl/MRDRNA2_/MRDRNA2_77977_c0~~gnl/MRDRNA2_/MRDRNA2_77977_c0_seq2.p1  ORF type:complete len:110 (+),score=14.55 gnl/MRDRNA2_/MRDRNA2_77977_c0_seq2:193-522(+)
MLQAPMLAVCQEIEFATFWQAVLWTSWVLPDVPSLTCAAIPPSKIATVLMLMEAASWAVMDVEWARSSGFQCQHFVASGGFRAREVVGSLGAWGTQGNLSLAAAMWFGT